MTTVDISEDFKQNVALILDQGSSSIKAGFSGDEKPHTVIRSVLGFSKKDQTQCYFYSNIHCKNSDDVILKKPVTGGMIRDWDSLEKLWSHVLYEELKVCPEEHGILMTDPAFSPISNREKTSELLFETFGAPAMYVCFQPVLSIYSYGLVTGLVVDSGAECTSITPVYSGYCLPHATFHMDLAGKGVSEYLSRLLADVGHGTALQQRSSVCDVKRQCCYVSQDFEVDLMSEDRVTSAFDYRLPDGTTVTLGNELFRGPEILFRPSITGLLVPGVHILAKSSLEKCASEYHEALLANVALCGGSSMFSGFPERLQAEMEKLLPRDSKVGLLSGPHREFASWVGGSIVTCLSSFQRMWVKRQEYEEEGSSVVLNKIY